MKILWVILNYLKESLNKILVLLEHR